MPKLPEIEFENRDGFSMAKNAPNDDVWPAWVIFAHDEGEYKGRIQVIVDGRLVADVVVYKLYDEPIDETVKSVATMILWSALRGAVRAPTKREEGSMVSEQERLEIYNKMR